MARTTPVGPPAAAAHAHLSPGLGLDRGGLGGTLIWPAQHRSLPRTTLDTGQHPRARGKRGRADNSLTLGHGLIFCADVAVLLGCSALFSFSV